MTPEQQAAFVIAQATCAAAKIAEMQEANMVARLADQPVPYTSGSFASIPNLYVIGHNAVIGLFHNDRT